MHQIKLVSDYFDSTACYTSPDWSTVQSTRLKKKRDLLFLRTEYCTTHDINERHLLLALGSQEHMNSKVFFKRDILHTKPASHQSLLNLFEIVQFTLLKVVLPKLILLAKHGTEKDIPFSGVNFASNIDVKNCECDTTI